MPLFCLISFHGTQVEYDLETDRLIHRPVSMGAGNIRLSLDRSNATLLCFVSETPRRLNLHSGRIASDEETINASTVTMSAMGNGLVSLYLDGRYLCAEADATVSFNRPVAQTWESFLLVDVSVMQRLAGILVNRWLPPRSSDLVAANLLDAHQFRIGNVPALPLTQMLETLGQTEWDTTTIPKELCVQSRGWQRSFFTLFRPLAVFVAYGNDKIFECAELAIRSLFEFGKWEGDVLLVTESGRSGFVETLPVSIRDRVVVACIPATDILDYTLARYKIIDLPLLQNYQPVFYIDTDVICDAPLATLVRDVAASRDLHLYNEAPINTHHYYGSLLLEEETTAFDPDGPGYSSGIIALSNIELHRSLFRDTIEVAYRYTGAHATRHHFGLFDQPFLNYVVYKSNYPIGSLLQETVRIHVYHHGARPPTSKGFAHFAGGMGEAALKLERMRQYYEALREKADR